MPFAIKMAFTSIGVIALASITLNCSNKVMDDHQGEKAVPSRSIEEVLSEYTEDLMSIPGVVGIAQGLLDGKPCIKVFVIKKTPELDQKVPDVLEGHPVMVEETGVIRALPEEQ